MFIQLTVEYFNIGAKEIEGYNEKCGYGGIFIFSGHGDINQMVRITEFCGSMGAAVVDYENERYSGKFKNSTTVKYLQEKIMFLGSQRVAKNKF